MEAASYVALSSQRALDPPKLDVVAKQPGERLDAGLQGRARAFAEFLNGRRRTAALRVSFSRISARRDTKQGNLASTGYSLDLALRAMANSRCRPRWASATRATPFQLTRPARW